MQKVIGGEFEISDLNRHVRCNLNEDFQFFSSGRAALFAILQYIKKLKGVNRILLPDYLCSSIVDTVTTSELEYTFYPVNNDLIPDMDFIRDEIQTKDSVLVINYFGLLKLEYVYEEIKQIHSPVQIIEDDVQALPSFLNPISDNVDFSFTSLRKWLPVPDGGLAKAKADIILPQPKNINTFSQYKWSGLFLKGNRDIGIDEDSIYLDLLTKGESLIDDNLTSRISEYTKNYFSAKYPHLDFNLRKRNSDYLLSGLEKIGIKPIIDVPDDITPFFIPIWLEDRDRVRREMFKENIFCPVHWPLDGLKIKKGAEMAEHELSLIIDQRYTFSDLDRILGILAK